MLNPTQPNASVRVYLKAVAILLASRLVVFLAMIFSARFVTPSIHAAGETNNPWYRYLLRWDAGWYLLIVKDGYSSTGDESVQQSISFNPVYPLMSKAVALALGISPEIALLVVANLLLVVGILLLFKLIRDEYGDDVGLVAVATLCFFPSSIFFTAGYTESSALVFFVACFLAMKGKRWLLASVFIGLAVGTRLMSLILIPPLIWELWREFGQNKKRLLVTSAATLVVATSGLWLYMIYTWAAFGRPWAIISSKQAWHGTGSGNELFSVITLQPFKHLADIFRDGPIPETLAPWIFLLFIGLLLGFRKLLPTRYQLLAAGGLVMPYFLAGGNRGFVSFTRYLLLVFPFFIIMAQLFKRRLWLGLTVMVISTALLFMHAAFYAQAYWAG